MNKVLKGTFAVMVTPFDANEEVDFKGLEDNIEWYIQKGIHGLIPLGSTGEFASMTHKERLKVTEFVVKQVDGRIPVCVGAGAETTKEAIEYTINAQDVGADGVLILPPYYFNPQQDEIINYFEIIAENVQIPIMIYNNPGTTGVDITLNTVLELSKTNNLEYIKESTGDIIRLREIERQSKNSIVTFCGCDELALESFFWGAKGWVSVVANALPELAAVLFETAYSKNYEKAKDIYNVLLPLCIELENSGRLVQVIKYCLTKRGLSGGVCRKPRLSLTPEHCAKLDRIMEDALKVQDKYI